ncbi:unnamed protein product [Linum tenue]|uniref:Uncharacterized protein n=1 Tax=Linum tenue TaxID=586396 RepID=A0AAV0NSI8_9ROSI|nr:unnamed protein product [Linum tenue]
MWEEKNRQSLRSQQASNTCPASSATCTQIPTPRRAASVCNSPLPSSTSRRRRTSSPPAASPGSEQSILGAGSSERRSGPNTSTRSPWSRRTCRPLCSPPRGRSRR